jgi:N-acetylglucosaminyldiphosphoundecaprenol N-acetyl-beta-D-mannosaminyltransferase
VETESRRVKRIKVLGVPVDVVDPDMALAEVERLLDNGQHNQIALLTVRGLLRARRESELARTLRDAALVLPASVGVVRGARFLKAGEPSLFSTFDLVIRLLSLVERLKGSVYLLGGTKEVLETAETNLRGSFHGIRVVGRYNGFFPRTMEADIVTAIKKSAPTLLLAGTGLPGRETWLQRHRRELAPGISLWAGTCFEIFAGAERQASPRLRRAGLSGLAGFWRRPWRIVLVFPHLWYGILLVIHRVFR